MRTKEIIKMIKKLPKDRIIVVEIKYMYYDCTIEDWKPATLYVKDSLLEEGS